MNRSLPIIVLLVGCLCLASCGSGNRSGTTGPPAQPLGLKFELVPSGLRVSWDRVSGASHYTLFAGKEPGEYRFTVDSTDSSVILVGLEKCQFYAMAVTAWNSRGESDFSSEEFVIYDDDPTNAAAYVEAGNDLMQRGFLADAYVYITTAIRLDPNSAGAYRTRALVNERMSRPDRARQDHSRAERIEKKKNLSSALSDDPFAGRHLVKIRTSSPQ
jgi:tetratricopeptide (TPR) repeat protein